MAVAMDIEQPDGSSQHGMDLSQSHLCQLLGPERGKDVGEVAEVSRKECPRSLHSGGWGQGREKAASEGWCEVST